MEELEKILDKLQICIQGKCLLCEYTKTYCTDSLIDEVYETISNYLKGEKNNETRCEAQ